MLFILVMTIHFEQRILLDITCLQLFMFRNLITAVFFVFVKGFLPVASVYSCGLVATALFVTVDVFMLVNWRDLFCQKQA
jgi:hypothetical protein